MDSVNQAISAGLGGFFALFLLALALWFLMRSMLGHLRSADRHVFEGESPAGETGPPGAGSGGGTGESLARARRPGRALPPAGAGLPGGALRPPRSASWPARLR